MSAPKNLTNPELVDAELLRLARNQDPLIVKWITSIAKKYLLTEIACFRRLSMTDVMKAYKQHPWMLKAYPRGVPIHEFDPDDLDFQRFTEELEHAILYLVDRIQSGQRNINPIDFETANQEGTRLLEREKIKDHVIEGPEDKELIVKYNNGYAWFDLKTKRALRHESTFMGHCVGNESMGYINRLESGSLRILSLRSKNNEPHVTIELQSEQDLGYLRQLKGKANRGVAEKYRSACIGLIKDLISKDKVRRVNVTDLLMSKITNEDLGVTIQEDGTIVKP